jgi:hypothetical protein
MALDVRCRRRPCGRLHKARQHLIWNGMGLQAPHRSHGRHHFDHDVLELVGFLVICTCTILIRFGLSWRPGAGRNARRER